MFVVVPYIVLNIAVIGLALVLGWLTWARSVRPYGSAIWALCLFLGVDGIVRLIDLFYQLPLESVVRTVFLWLDVVFAVVAFVLLLRMVFKVRDLPTRSDLQDLLLKLGNEVEHHKWTKSLLESKTQELLRTERARAQEQVDRTQRKCSEVISQIKGMAIFEVDKDFKVCSWNKGAETLLGYAAPELSSKGLEVFTRDRSCWVADVPDSELGSAQVVEEQRTVEGWWYREDGQRFWALASLRRIPPEHGLTEKCGCKNRYIVIVRDMSDRMNISKELARESQRLRSVLNTIGDAVVTMDSSGVLQRWNRAAEAMFGYTGAEIRGRSVGDFFPQEFNDSVQRLISDYFHQATDRSAMRWDNLQAVRKNGERFPVEVEVGRFSFEGEDYYTGVIRDITDFKRVQEKLQVAKEDAEAASVAKSRFLAGISHELRTPLTIISGYADLIGVRVDDPAYVQSKLGLIKRHCRLLLTIISDLLDLTKAEAGKLTIQAEPFELMDLLRQVNEMFRVLTEERNLNLDFQLGQSGPFWVRSDSVRIRQVLSNLLSNAIKFSRPGGTVVVRPHLYAVDGRCELTVEVEDNGVGIARDRIAVLFQPFMQADHARSQRLGGTGLGLVLSRGLARLLGGDVDLVRTEEGRGSIFRARFNMEMLSATEIEYVDRVEKHDVSSATAKLSGYTILVVDDTEEILTLTSEILKYFGADILAAENGAQALMVYQEHRRAIDLVLMDIRMPVMDGWEARRRLEALGCAAPIVALTANAMTDEVQNILDGGFDGYLSKPLDPSNLVNTISLLIKEFQRKRDQEQVAPYGLSRNLDDRLI